MIIRILRIWYLQTSEISGEGYRVTKGTIHSVIKNIIIMYPHVSVSLIPAYK